MVEMGVKGEVKTTILPLEPLRQVKVVKGTLEEVLKESCKDYVTVILTDKADLDVIDMQERIRLAFPTLLEIRRENQRKTDYTRTLQTEELLDPYE
ncbi:exonuclease SbcCD subunit D C-terminal domain-containing protein, partial [Blautia schinkii]|uniref:exonuclease SbcCD subunit D C-terminal domain-containing protein n=1 Tax=Blautia schinkii TaxID=180164 RepID=UPI0023B02EE4